MSCNNMIGYSDRIAKMEVEVEIFCRWGVERWGGVSKIFLDTRLRKRLGVNFVINYNL